MNDYLERLVNKSSLCVPTASLTQTLPVLSVQQRQGGSGTTAHVSSMLSGFPPSISLPRNVHSAVLKMKGEGPLCAPAMLLTNGRSFHTLPVSLSALYPSHHLDSPSKGKEKKKKCMKSSFWILLSVALLLKRCQCVCGALTLLPH